MTPPRESDTSGVPPKIGEAIDHAIAAAALVGAEINLHIIERRGWGDGALEAEKQLRTAASILRGGVFNTTERR